LAAFENCTGLKLASLPQGLTQLGLAAFKGCIGLTKVTFPDSLTQIEGWVFEGCTGLTAITLPGSLIQIENYAFLGCTALKQIVFPESLTEVEEGVFEGCISLQDIIINTQSEVEFNRIKALFPDNLQDKVIDKARYEALSEKAKKIRQEALEMLCWSPKINPLLGAIPFFRATDEACKLPMINNVDLIFNINEYVGRDSEIYRLAEDAMLALALPRDATQFEAYKNQLATIITQHKPIKKIPANTEQAADTEINSPDEAGRNVRPRL
jgi:hypothetical protein